MRYRIKTLFLFLFLFCLFNVNTFAAHTHTSNCYPGTLHICDGDENTYGTCYKEQISTYHTHEGKDNTETPNGCYTKPYIVYHEHIGLPNKIGPYGCYTVPTPVYHIHKGEPNQTTANGCYIKPTYVYHQHIGEPNQTIANGCYTREVPQYHTHTSACVGEVEKPCIHTIIFADETGNWTFGMYNCPSCQNFTFEGFSEPVVCDYGSNLQIYQGTCSTCGYAGNGTWINETIQDDLPCSAMFTHYYVANEITCGKDETTVDSIIYDIGCGKNEGTIDGKIYDLGCGKSETTVEKTVYSLGCGKDETTIEKTLYTLDCTKTSDTIESVKYKNNCNKENGAYYSEYGAKVKPQCHVTVTSIKAKYPIQKTDNPDFTLIVTYLDGHVEENKATIANWNSSMTYNDTDIPLYYTCKTKVNGSYSTLTTNIKLTSIKNSTNPPTPTLIPLPTQSPIIIVKPTIMPTPTLTPNITIVQKPNTTQNSTTNQKDATTKTPTLIILQENPHNEFLENEEEIEDNQLDLNSPYSNNETSLSIFQKDLFNPTPIETNKAGGISIGLIIAIIVSTILVLGGLGIFIFLYIQNKKINAISIEENEELIGKQYDELDEVEPIKEPKNEPQIEEDDIDI